MKYKEYLKEAIRWHLTTWSLPFTDTDAQRVLRDDLRALII